MPTCCSWSRMYLKIPAEMSNQINPTLPASPSIFPGQDLPSRTGKILTKQKHTHLLVRLANAKRNMKFRNFKRSTANHKLLQVWNKWKRSSRYNSPTPYKKSLSSVKAFEVLSYLLWSTYRYDALTTSKVYFPFISLSLLLTFCF